MSGGCTKNYEKGFKTLGTGTVEWVKQHFEYHLIYAQRSLDFPAEYIINQETLKTTQMSRSESVIQPKNPLNIFVDI